MGSGASAQDSEGDPLTPVVWSGHFYSLLLLEEPENLVGDFWGGGLGSPTPSSSLVLESESMDNSSH